MASSNQDLKTLLAQGKLEQALDALLRLTERTDAADLRQRVLTLSGQFFQLKKQHLTGLLEDKDYRWEWNRISTAVVEIADSEAVDSDGVTSSHPVTKPRNWEKWALILGIFAAIAGITGYTLRDFWQKKEPAPATQPVVEPTQKDTPVVATPPVIQPVEKSSTGKNNVTIKVQDKAKVGNIVTGDSNKIDIKQDF